MTWKRKTFIPAILSCKNLPSWIFESLAILRWNWVTINACWGVTSCHPHVICWQNNSQRQSFWMPQTVQSQVVPFVPSKIASNRQLPFGAQKGLQNWSQIGHIWGPQLLQLLYEPRRGRQLQPDDWWWDLKRHASSKGCCLNPNRWCIGTPYHPFSTPKGRSR